MRISGGNLRGRRLAVEATGIRPTSVRVREALFDILAHGDVALDLPATNVLDAFAGTGALGLEAVSRGAAHVTFMETNQVAVTALKTLARELKVDPTTTILRADATKPSRPRYSPCQLALLDPPYGRNLALPAIAALDNTGWLDQAVTIVIESPAKEAIEPPPGFFQLDERRYGRSKLTFLQRTL